MKLQPTLKKLRRQLYGLRSFIPGWRRRHELELMVGPLGYWDELQAYQFRVVTHLGLLPHHSLLDIGCGPLQGGIAFIRYLEPGRYIGVDPNPIAIEAGREEISRHGLSGKNPRLLVSRDFGDGQLAASTFDFIWMSQILYYFDEGTMHQLFAVVRRRLRHTGLMAVTFWDPRVIEASCAPRIRLSIRLSHSTLSRGSMACRWSQTEPCTLSATRNV